MSVESAFREQIITERLVIPPDCVHDVASYVTAVLNRRLLVCTSKFNGVLVCYRAIKLIERAGAIVDEQPYVHGKIRYTATVFRPVRGTVLEGVVTKISEDHVACLVYDCFNAAILHSRHQDQTRNGWRGFSLSVSDRVTFSVTTVDHAHGVMSIRGKLLDTTEKKEDRDVCETEKDASIHSVDGNTSQSDTPSRCGSLKKSKNKKRSKLNRTTMETELLETPARKGDEADDVVQERTNCSVQNEESSDMHTSKQGKNKNAATNDIHKGETVEERSISKAKSVWAGLSKHKGSSSSVPVALSVKSIGDRVSHVSSSSPKKLKKKLKRAGSEGTASKNRKRKLTAGEVSNETTSDERGITQDVTSMTSSASQNPEKKKKWK